MEFCFLKSLFGAVTWQRGAVNLIFSFTTLQLAPDVKKEIVEVIKLRAYFILVKHCFQENHKELFAKWEISFPVAALWLNMNKVEVVQGNGERCFPLGLWVQKFGVCSRWVTDPIPNQTWLRPRYILKML